MAAYSNSVSLFDTAASGTIANAVPFNPGVGDLAIVFVGTTGLASVASAIADDNAGGSSWTLIGSALRTTSLDVQAAFVRTTPFSSTAGTTVTATIGAPTGAFIAVVLINGMSRYGSSAIRQFAREQNQTAGGPAPTYGVPALTTNLQLTCINTNANPPNCPGPAGFTSRVNGGYITPTAGFQLYTIDSGDTSTTVSWSGSAGNAYSDMAIEIDASADPVAAAATTPFPPLGRGASW